jgi:UDP-N-acetylmuramate dehydrogenase
MEIFEKLKKELPKIQKNIPLSRHTSFKIGGPAKFFFIAKTRRDLIKAIAAALKNKIPFFILSRGSNLLVSDKGYDGLVIKIQTIRQKTQDTKIWAEAGKKLSDLVQISQDNSLSGLEWATGIPGTIGGAIRGNAGAFGKSIDNVVKKVEVLEIKISKIKNFKNKDCKFKYRDSIFKRKKNLIILSAEIQLKKGDKKAIQKKIKELLNQRKKNQPLNFPSAGSIFKNPKNFSAGELMEKCGLKGKKINNAQISEKHANFIINLGGAKAKDVIKLITVVKKKVKDKFGIKLKEEIQYL